jgi:hypothetical protein
MFRLLGIKFVFSIVVISTIISCDRTHIDGEVLTTGPVGDINVVCDNNLWTEEIIEMLDTTISPLITPYFPEVSTFKLLQKTPQHFENGNKQLRNLLFITVDENFKEDKASIIVSLEKFATNQTLVRVVAGSLSQLKDAIATRFKLEVFPYFDNDEWKRLQNSNSKINNKDINIELSKNFGIELDVPQGSKLVTSRANFYRVEFPVEAKGMDTQGERGINIISQSGVLIYQYPVLGDSSMTMKSLLMARDTMIRYNVPHEIDGMYMATQYARIVAPEMYDFINYTGSISGKEIRGMFKFIDEQKEPYTGGAFWEFHFLHPSRKTVVCISGYLDAPSNTSWIFQLRRLQAVIKSVRTTK